jgi:putative transposase
VLCLTNAIKSSKVRYPPAVKARSHFPISYAAINEPSQMKALHLVTRALKPNGTGRTRWAVRWKPPLNAFGMTFADRMPAAETN